MSACVVCLRPARNTGAIEEWEICEECVTSAPRRAFGVGMAPIEWAAKRAREFEREACEGAVKDSGFDDQSAEVSNALHEACVAIRARGGK